MWDFVRVRGNIFVANFIFDLSGGNAGRVCLFCSLSSGALSGDMA